MPNTQSAHGLTPVLTIGEVARRGDVPVSTLHFYESKGLIASERSTGNQRRYARDVLRRIAFIRAAQQVGIALADIKSALDTLPAGHSPSQADWQRLASRWREDLDARIVRLRQLRDTLDDCIACGCLSLQNCRLRNPQDRLAVLGPGPQRLWGCLREKS